MLYVWKNWTDAEIMAANDQLNQSEYLSGRSDGYQKDSAAKKE